MINFIGWLIVGLIAGALARLIMPGRDPMGIIATILLGIVGSILGGLVSWAIWGSDTRGFQPAGLLLRFQNAEAAENGEAGILQNRKLPREGREIARPNAAKDKPALLLGAGRVSLLASLLRRDLRHEVAHLPNGSLGFFFGRRLDYVFNLGAGRIHRLELKSWHFLALGC